MWMAYKVIQQFTKDVRCHEVNNSHAEGLHESQAEPVINDQSATEDKKIKKSSDRMGDWKEGI